MSSASAPAVGRQHLEVLGRQPRLEQFHIGANVVDDEDAGVITQPSNASQARWLNASPMNRRTVSMKCDRDRLGDVGLAAALADALLVALHGEGGHRDHRECRAAPRPPSATW